MRRSDFMLGGHDFKTLVASQIMETNISMVGEDVSWRETARVMADNNIRSVPVVNENSCLLGLITEYDILGPIAEGKDVGTIKAKDIMSKAAQTVGCDSLATNVLKIFDDKRVFKVLVVEKDVLKGVIVKHDVLFAYLSATEEPVNGY